jgi:hypothetical protein
MPIALRAISVSASALCKPFVQSARAEEEAGREIVKRIPKSDKLEMEMVEHAREQALRADERRRLIGSLSSAALVKPVTSYPVILQPALDSPAVQ